MKSNFLMLKLVCFLTTVILLAGCMTAQDYVKKGVKSKNFYESERNFNKALELNPYDLEMNKTIAVKYVPEIQKNKGERRAELFEKAQSLDPENLDILYANGYALYFRDRDFRAAANVYEEILKLNPDYRCKNIGNWGVPAGTFGFKNTNQFSKTSGRLSVENVSLSFLVGVAYHDYVNDSKLSQTVKTELLEKALHYLLNGYEMDIDRGGYNTPIAKTLYLIQMARTAELNGDYEIALQSYSAFMSDSSITLDKNGIRDKMQPLYSKVNQQSPAVASNTTPTPPVTGSSSNQQKRPAPIDMTGDQANFAHGVEVGGVYKFKIPAKWNQLEFIMVVPPYIKSVTIFTEGDLDTEIQWGGMTSLMATMMGMFPEEPKDMIITDDQSASDRNASVKFPTIPVSSKDGSRKLAVTVTEKNKKSGGIFTLVIQGSR